MNDPPGRIPIESEPILHSMGDLFAIDPDGYEKRMTDAVERVSGDLASLARGLVARNNVTVTAPYRKKEYKPKLPGKRAWDTLRVVDCFMCKAMLLSPEEEKTRRLARTNRLRCLKHFPPPVAQKIGDRFLCHSCLEDA